MPVPGQSVGPYVVERELGRGGMGVVLLGRDPRLDRSVAIKMLPEELASDPMRLERFEREARTLAQLNHANVAGILGVEELEGDRYLILEYVDGVTLADRLDAGPLPVEEAIEIAVQIAAGVAAAHDAGVVHRDLKPANIIVTPEGGAKVLDFGLARADDGSTMSSGTSAAASTIASADTIPSEHPPEATDTVPAGDTMPMSRGSNPTMAGAVIGTAAYMSPEQARGRRVDRRSDVWSFGVVLYEMLSGGCPFHGESAADSIGAVLHKQFDLAHLPSETPLRVRRVLERCLVRDRAKRYRDIGDLRLELLTPDPVAPEVGAERRLAHPAALGALAVLAGIGGAAIAWLAKPQAPIVEPAVIETDISLPAGERFAHRMFPGITIAPDASAIAFVSGVPPQMEDENDTLFGGSLAVRRLGQPEPVPLVGIDPAAGPLMPVFSPDGTELAYIDARGTVARIPAEGGRPTDVCTLDAPPCGLDWGDDGRLVYGSSAGLRAVDAVGGLVEPLTEAEGGSRHVLPHVLPGARGILYTVLPASDQTRLYTVWVRDGETGETRQVLENASSPQYALGRLVFARDGELLSVPFDIDSLSVTGDERRAGIDVAHAINGPNTRVRNGSAQFALSPGGTLAYGAGGGWPDVPTEVVLTSEDGETEVLDIAPRGYASVRFSPNGEFLLLDLFHPAASSTWFHDLSRGVTQRAYDGRGTLWSSWGPGEDEITINDARATGERMLGHLIVGGQESDITEIPPSPVGMTIASGWNVATGTLMAVAAPPSGGADLVRWSPDDGWTAVTSTPAVAEAWPDVSPDGSLVAYTSDESGRFEIYVRPIDGGIAVQVTDEGAVSPCWSRDGSRLYYVTRGDRDDDTASMVAVDVTREASGRLRFGAAEVLFDAREASLTVPIRPWDVGPDGRFAMIRSASVEARTEAVESHFPDRIRLIQNWISAGAFAEVGAGTD